VSIFIQRTNNTPNKTNNRMGEVSDQMSELIIEEKSSSNHSSKHMVISGGGFAGTEVFQRFRKIHSYPNLLNITYSKYINGSK
jgi:hypothetical protein